MRHRLFIAINLPDEVKRHLSSVLTSLIPQFPDVRFVKPENIHLTISFLGYQNDDMIPNILEAMQITADNAELPEISLTKIVYALPGKKPRMLWLAGDEATDEKLGMIKKRAEDEMNERSVRFDREEFRKFHTHATLARFESSQNYGVRDAILLPEFTARFEATSLDLMESHLGRRGPEYALLNAFTFGE